MIASDTSESNLHSECYRSLCGAFYTVSLELNAHIASFVVSHLLYFHRYYVPNMSQTAGRLAQSDGVPAIA